MTRCCLRAAGLPVDGLAGRARLLRRARPDAVPSPLWYLSDPVRFARFREQTERTRDGRAASGCPGACSRAAAPSGSSTCPSDANFPRRAGAGRRGLRGGFSFPIPVLGETHAVSSASRVDTVTPDDRLLEVVSHIGRQLGRLIAGTRPSRRCATPSSRFRSFAESANDAIIAADDQRLDR